MNIVGSVSETQTEPTGDLRVRNDGQWGLNLTNFDEGRAIVHFNWIVIDWGTSITFFIFEYDLDLRFTSLVSSLKSGHWRVRLCLNESSPGQVTRSREIYTV
jgi:hypothetical protein